VHEQRIVHSDLKPANFLLVEGQLKLIDFGIAKAISGDTTSIARESQVRLCVVEGRRVLGLCCARPLPCTQLPCRGVPCAQVGTLNYMSPEAILGGSTNILGGPAMKVGRPSDVWSLGCILFQMVAGR
jgi:serine/threonine-protein kinase TTK/MPS1